MKWFIYSISSLATAAVATVAVVIGSTIYTLFSLNENVSKGEAFFGAVYFAWRRVAKLCNDRSDYKAYPLSN